MITDLRLSFIIVSMGDSLSVCCNQPLSADGPARQIITIDGADGFKQQLEQFFAKFPKIKEVYAKLWHYCNNVDKDTVTITGEGVFIGKQGTHGLTNEMIVLYNQGFLYEGEIVDGKREGCGRLISGDGDTYQGKWKHNQSQGEGIYQGVHPRRKYTGVWSKGNLQGKGKASYEDGSHYEGQFYMNSRHGKGKIVYADGTTYEGDFKNNIIEGFGTLVGINHKYEGSWKGGKMQGAGKSSWYNQNQLLQTYYGQYLNGMKHGKGEYRWSTGRVFKGEWENGEIKNVKNVERKNDQ